VSVGRDS